MTRALAVCAVTRAGKSAATSDWVTVLAELRRGLRDAPADATLNSNLAVALHNHAAVLIGAGKCAELRALRPELKPADATLLAALQRACP